MTWSSIVKNHKTHLALTAVLSAGVGAGAGILAYARVVEAQFQERLQAEIQEAKVFYQEMYSTPTFVAEEPSPNESALLERVREATDEHDGPPVDLVGQALSAMSTYDPEASEEEEELLARKSPVVVNNIFTNATPPGEEVLGALMADRDPSKPYIITKNEYFQNEPDNEQIAFTYWEGDDVLVDDRYEFQPIEDHELVAGEDNLLRFGYGSGDENIVYIRNEAVDPPMDLVITKSTGKYAVEVMAIDEGPHLEHVQKRFRPYHDE